MPRKHPLPEQERKICARLAAFREETKLSRAAFAREVGVNRFTLANVEGAAAPVTFPLALRIQDRFQMNLAWLATGDGNTYGKPKFHRAFVPSEKELLSVAFDKYLKPAVENRERLQGVARNAGLSLDFPDAIGSPVAEVYASRMLPEIVAALKSINPHNWGDYQRALNQLSVDFTPGKKAVLDKITASGKSTDVKLTMATLLARLNKATEAHGMKSKLAKYMGVPLPNVSQWLSGEREPSGETTLRLLHWVEQQERKK